MAKKSSKEIWLESLTLTVFFSGASMGPISSDGQSRTVNFAVNSRNATQMSLCIARRKPDGKCGGYLEIALDPGVNRKGDAWNASLDGLRDLETLCYGWRADADIKWDMGNRFHPGQFLLHVSAMNFSWQNVSLILFSYKKLLQNEPLKRICRVFHLIRLWKDWCCLDFTAPIEC